MTNHFDIAMISCCIPNNQEHTIRINTVSGMQNAANALQNAYFKGIENITGQHIHLINALPVGTYPLHYKKIFIKGSDEIRAGISSDIDVSFVNMQFVTNISKYHAIKKPLRKWLNTKTENQKILIGYAMTGYVLHALRYAKKIAPNVITCLIIPDLPQYMSDNSHKLYKVLWNKHAMNIFAKSRSSIDCYSLITEQCAKFLNIKDNYVVIEGICDSKINPKEEIIIPKEKTMLYTGGLYEKYGVKKLIDSFRAIKETDMKLVLYGDGELKNDIIKISKQDERVKYGGLIGHNECVSLQRKAYCLINPRERSDYTEYSFPSKTIEYLVSGTPTLCFLLQGMPDEYADYIIRIDDNTGGIESAIKKVENLSTDEYRKIALDGMRFIQIQKNANVQCLKLFRMIEGLSLEIGNAK